MNSTYFVTIHPGDNGTFMVTMPDVPDVHTMGSTIQEALFMAEDALLLSLSMYMEGNRGIPQPSKFNKTQPTVTLPPLAAKLAIYQVMRDQGGTQLELANRLQCDSKQVRRLLDLDHNSRLDQLENALKALGKKLVVQIMDAA